MHRFLTVLRSAAIAFAILAFGHGVWGALLTSNLMTTPAIPWSMPAMGAVLWAMWRFLSNTPARRELLSANKVPTARTVWTLVTGILAVISLAGLWIVLFQLVKMAPNMIPGMSKYPWWTMLSFAVMGSLVAPIVEEAGFRGYCQTALERVFPGSVAVLISTILFTMAHLNHGLYWPKLLVYFLFGAVMGTMAYMNKSILPGIPAHSLGDLVFFTLVWPNDAGRLLVSQHGADTWFWIHVAQTVVFGALTLVAFRKLRNAPKAYNTLTEVNACEFSSQTNLSSPVATA
jgi:membrane protease YdiL (CAAX protease family)